MLRTPCKGFINEQGKVEQKSGGPKCWGWGLKRADDDGERVPERSGSRAAGQRRAGGLRNRRRGSQISQETWRSKENKETTKKQ